MNHYMMGMFKIATATWLKAELLDQWDCSLSDRYIARTWVSACLS